MAQHKWHKEIKAYADGAEIEFRFFSEGKWCKWDVVEPPVFNTDDDFQYRIKPQTKEPVYLYVYFDTYVNRIAIREEPSDLKTYRFVCKIKGETEDGAA